MLVNIVVVATVILIPLVAVLWLFIRPTKVVFPLGLTEKVESEAFRTCWAAGTNS